MLIAAPHGTTDFSGHWKLDTSKSVNLPSSFAQVESYTMNVRQTVDSMIIVVELSGGGQHVTFPVTTYAFGGAEVFREDTVRQSRRWTTCSWSSNGKNLLVSSRVEQGAGEKKKEYVQHDSWNLGGPGTLRILVTQKFTRGDSTRNEQRVFHRMK
jgi:hypothetical protein